MPEKRTISGCVNISLIEDGVTYQIEASVGSVTIASNATGATLTTTVRFYSKEGSADRAALSCYSCVFKKSGSTYTRVTSEYNRAYNSKQSSGTISNLSVGTSVNAVVVCIYAYPSQAHEGYLYEFEIPVYKSGDKGDKGDTNKRMPYYAGTLSEVGGEVIVANDYSTPYVDVETGTADHPNCYVYVGSNTSSGKTYPTTAQAYSSSSDWERMTSDFKYLILKAIFSNYAELGSWMFCGDYMMSAKDPSGNARGSQTFNGIGSETGFKPSIVFDASNGRASFGGDKVRFNPDGSGWLAGGKISLNANGSATFEGDITATGGTIGGFTIERDRLYNSKWDASIDINYDSKSVKIGKNAKGVMATENAIIRAENTKTGQTYNTALFLNVANATHNYAFYGNGNGVLNGVVTGFKFSTITISDSSSYLYSKFSNGCCQVITGSHSSGHVYIAAPTLSDVRQTLGISSATPFAVEMTYINSTNYDSIAICFRGGEISGTDYPYLTRPDGGTYTGSDANVTVTNGGTFKIFLVYNNSSFRAYRISYYHS